MSSTFVIFLPQYTEKSAGVRAMWNLSDAMTKNGRPVINIIYQQSISDLFVSFDGTEWIKCSKKSIPEMVSALYRPIVIHPEGLDCSFFASLNVARYYLNRMGVLINKGRASSTEYKIAFNTLYCSSPHFMLPQYLGKINLDEALGMNIKPRMLDLTYVGKGTKYLSSTPPRKDSLLFDRDWPQTNAEYLTLLACSRVLFSYDIVTSVLLDCVLMGVVPIALTWEPFTELEIRKSLPKNFPLYENAEFDSQNFNFDKFYSQRLKFIESYKKEIKNFDAEINRLCNELEFYFHQST